MVDKLDSRGRWAHKARRPPARRKVLARSPTPMAIASVASELIPPRRMFGTRLQRRSVPNSFYLFNEQNVGLTHIYREQKQYV